MHTSILILVYIHYELLQVSAKHMAIWLAETCWSSLCI